jgi:hypothetical protein
LCVKLRINKIDSKKILEMEEKEKDLYIFKDF